MVEKNKEVFTISEDGKEIELAILRPTAKQRAESDKFYNKTWKELIQSGALLRAVVDKIAKQQGLWDDDMQSRYEVLGQEIYDNRRKLLNGGMSKQEGKELALKIKKLVREQRDLLNGKNSVDSMTAEAQAEHLRFLYLLNSCLVYNNNGKVYFKDFDEFQNNLEKDVVVKAAEKFIPFYINSSLDFEAKLPENKFLKKFGFCDDKFRLLDPVNQWFVDEEGRRIDEDGRYLTPNGEYCDMYGNLVDKEGNPIVEEKPFTD